MQVLSFTESHSGLSERLLSMLLLLSFRIVANGVLGNDFLYEKHVSRLYPSLTKHSFKGILLSFLKAALCRPPRLVPPAGSDTLVPPDSETYYGSPKFRNLPKFTLTVSLSYHLTLPFEVTIWSYLSYLLKNYLLKSPFSFQFKSYLLFSTF